MFFIDMTGFDCGGAGVLRIIKFVFTLLDVVFFLVPMGLILMMTVDIAKNVIAGRVDDMKKNLNIAIKRLIYCMALFFVPIIVQFAINLLGDLGVEYADCIEIAQTHDLSQYEINTDYDYNYDGETPNFNKGNGYTVTEDSANSNSGSSGNGSDLVYYNQGDYGNVLFCSSGYTVKNSGCGAVSLAMIASSFNDKKYNPQYMAEWLCSNGHNGAALNTSFFTSEDVLDTFKLSAQKLFDKSSTYKSDSGRTYNSEEGQKILQAVKEGKGVILYVPGHYSVVGSNSSCSNDEVYFYDVGTINNNGCYTLEKLFLKTYNYNNECNYSGNCGWKGAWSYTSK